MLIAILSESPDRTSAFGIWCPEADGPLPATFGRNTHQLG